MSEYKSLVRYMIFNYFLPTHGRNNLTPLKMSIDPQKLLILMKTKLSMFLFTCALGVISKKELFNMKSKRFKHFFPQEFYSVSYYVYVFDLFVIFLMV